MRCQHNITFNSFLLSVCLSVPLQKKKGKKGKKEKDLTPDRTIESLYMELAQEGIVSCYPKVRLSEFLGEFWCGTNTKPHRVL